MFCGVVFGGAVGATRVYLRIAGMEDRGFGTLQAVSKDSDVGLALFDWGTADPGHPVGSCAKWVCAFYSEEFPHLILLLSPLALRFVLFCSPTIIRVIGAYSHLAPLAPHLGE